MASHEPSATDPAVTSAGSPSKKPKKWYHHLLGLFWAVSYGLRSSKARQLFSLAAISGAVGSAVVRMLNRRYGKKDH